VEQNFDKLEALRQQVKDAIAKAEEAKKHSGFWGTISSVLGGDIGAIAAAVAAVAACVLTGGAAAAVLAVVASAVSIAAQHAEELGIPPEIAMGIAIAAAGASLLTGNASGLIQVSEGVRKVASTVRFVASVTAGVATVAGGAASVAHGAYERTSLDAEADAHSAQGHQTLVNLDIDDAIKALSRALDQCRETTETTSNVLGNHQEANEFLISNFLGAA
jgi:hypothetical protein